MLTKKTPSVFLQMEWNKFISPYTNHLTTQHEAKGGGGAGRQQKCSNTFPLHSSGHNRPTLLTYSMQQGPWEANWFSVIQEIPRILWYPKIHYHTDKYRHLSLTNTGVFISHRAVWDHPTICKLFVTYDGIQHQKVKGMLISMPIDTSLLFPGT